MNPVPVWARLWGSPEELISEFATECRIVRKGPPRFASHRAAQTRPCPTATADCYTKLNYVICARRNARLSLRPVCGMGGSRRGRSLSEGWRVLSECRCLCSKKQETRNSGVRIRSHRCRGSPPWSDSRALVSLHQFPCCIEHEVVLSCRTGRRPSQSYSRREAPHHRGVHSIPTSPLLWAQCCSTPH